METQIYIKKQFTCYLICVNVTERGLAHNYRWYSCYFIFSMVMTTEVEELHAVSLISRHFSFVV